VPDEDLDIDSFDPNDDVEDEDLDEETFEPYDDVPDEDLDIDSFDPNDDVEDEDLDEESFDPYDDVPDEDLDEESFEPYDDVPDEDPEIDNLNNSGTITVVVPEQPEQEPENDPENEPLDEPENEPDPEVVPDWVSPEDLAGGDIPGIPVPDSTFEFLEEPESEPVEEPDPEIVPEWASPEDLAGDNIPEIVVPDGTFEPIEPESEPIEEPEQEPDMEIIPEWVSPEDLAGDSIPEIPVPDGIFEPLEEPESEPVEEPDPEIVPEWVPPEDLAGDNIPEIPVPDGTFEPLEEPESEPIEKSEEKPQKKNSEGSLNDNHPETLQEGTNIMILASNTFSSHNNSKPFEVSTPKEENQKKKGRQIPRKRTHYNRKDSGSDKKNINRQKSGQSIVLVLKPELKDKQKEKESKKESEKKAINKEVDDKEIKAAKERIQKDTPKKEKEVEEEIPKELKDKYRQETGKRPIYNRKITKGFDEWLKNKAKLEQKKQNEQDTQGKTEPKEDWEKLLEKWINEADEKEIPKEIKKELIEKIRKYQEFRKVARALRKLLEKENLSENEIHKMEELIKDLNELQDDIFTNLRAFRDLYIKNIDWFEYRIKAERDKFILHLNQKMKNLKSTTGTISKEQSRKDWKKTIKENLYKNTTLNINERSLIIKIIKKHKLDEGDKKQLISMLSKLTIEDLISLLGSDFKQHKQNFIKWGWDYDQAIKRLMLNTYIHNYYRVIETAKKEDGILLFSKDMFYNNPKFKEWLLIYNPSIVSREIKSQVITTRNFIEALRKLIQKVVPKEYLRKINGVFTLSDNKLSKFLGREERYIKTYINKYIRENPTFIIALDILKEWKSALKLNFGKLAKNAINLIDAYIILHKPVIPISRKKEMQIYRFHRLFNLNYFSVIDTIEKAYWLGFFFADGYITIINKKKTKIGIQVAKKDMEILLRWCGALGLNPNFIRPKKDKLLYKGETREYEGIVIEFSSPKMAKDLIALGYKGSRLKSTKWPEIDFKNRQLDLAFLLGFYDGEGFEGRTALCSHSRRILEDIKNKFKIPHKIRPRKDGGFVLSLGAKLFNEMMKNYKNSLQRKRFKVNIKKFGVKSWFESIMTKDLLQDLMDQMPISHIAKNFEVQDRNVLALIKKWNLKKKPKGYWNRRENWSKKI
ncbi:MAG: hypothetical protein ACFFB6_03855, partial [Promethearchaeota archaeon]